MRKPAKSHQIEKELSEKSLRHFIRNGWSSVESYKFSSNWHIDAICDHLEACADRQIKRLLINIPPRHMKSVGSCVFFPAWIWAQNPDPLKAGHGFNVQPETWRGPGVRFLNVSYAYALSARDAGTSKRLIESPFYQGHWGDRVKIRDDASAKDNYGNTAGGHRMALSLEGNLTGQGGDIILIDDPINVQDGNSDNQRNFVNQWWQESLQSRQNDPENSVIIVIMQRVHANDLSGHIIANELGWDHLVLPAEYEPRHPVGVKSSLGFKDPRTEEGQPLWEDRFPKKALKKLTDPMSAYSVAGQYQQRPAPRDGGMFKRNWFEIVAAAPANSNVVRRWDLAASKVNKNDPDYTVGVKISRSADGIFYIEHVDRFREGPAEVLKRVKNIASIDGRRTPIIIPKDPAQAGLSQVQHFVTQLAGYNIRAKPTSGSKEQMAEPFAAQAEVGNVKLVYSPLWNKPFLDELETFPNGAHDDQVDAAANGLNDLLVNFSGPLQGRYGQR